MTQRRLLIWIFVFFLRNGIFAQSIFNPGITITPAQTSFFSCLFPDNPQLAVDTTYFSLYKYSANDVDLTCVLTRKDSSFHYYLNVDAEEDSFYIESSDSLANPLVAMTIAYSNLYDSIEVMSMQDLSIVNTTITGREMVIAYMHNGGSRTLLAVRTYYNGHDILMFTAESLASNEQNFTAIKNDYFNSIIIY